MSSPEPTEEQLARLAAALRDADARQPKPFIPPTLDDRILKQARAHFERPRATPRPFLRWSIAFASIAVIATLTLTLIPQRKTFAAHDINRDGAVDILDAVARTVQMRTDPKIDWSEVEAIASSAVRLDQ